ncbi:50S ribosomal protein L2 [archaeon]|nr:50S ribosomal protein L2 [archaeon]
MGKRLTVQKRGKGSSVYKSPSHRHRGEVKHRGIDEKERAGVVTGKVVDIMMDPGRTAPVVRVRFEGGEKRLLLGTEGVQLGDEISYGASSKIKRGNTLPLSSIPEGTPISNVEKLQGDGGKFIRASGSYGLVVSHEGDKTVIQMPSGVLKTVHSASRATLGIVAGGGRREKPILKAGKAWHMQRPRARYWPIVRGVAMNAIAHPHGGGSGSPGKPTSVSRNTPPGRKVGLIAPRRTGRR